MGESGSRRSTLVSRLPIFRRGSSKRQESLPSSPSSGGVGNGVHTSSPSSTNSSSGSTGKRRSLFRTPSLSFSKRNSDPRVQPVNLNLTPPPPPPPTQDTDDNGNSHEAFSNNGGRTKSRHSFGFGSHKQKKISRSQTEDFNAKASSSSSSSANRNVFINCISGSGVNEGDDSGFLDDYSGASNNNKRSSRHKKPLLPKSFSAHQRFSRTSDHPRPPEVSQHSPPSTAITPHTAGLAPGSWPGELGGTGAESSLQSPMISEDLTTAITPSEFIPITEDSLSEADALPAPSPGCGRAQGPSPSPGPAPGPLPPSPSAAPETFSVVVSTSQVFFTPVQSSTDKPLLPDTSTNTDYDTAVSTSDPGPGVSSLVQGQLLLEEREEEEEQVSKEEPVEKRKQVVHSRRTTVSHTDHSTSESEGWYPNHEQMERRARTILSVQDRGNSCGCHDPRSSHLSKPYTASLCSSVSPYHEVIRLERRLRSSSEGAGGPRIHGNHREASSVDGCGLLKHRNNSSSSKLGSLDVLNNLGSSELDEDDLMLDLDLSDDQRHRHVSREDSSQSLASCINFLHSSMDASAERGALRENHHREAWPPSVLMPTDCSSALGPLGPGRDDDLLLTGLETLPFRLMQQDCTAVKTLLLRLRRTLQESREPSPASSLQSLPISPCSEKSLPFKEWTREDFLLQLKERDDLIVRLQTELESAKAALRVRDGQTTDRTTQTEHTGSEVSPPGRGSGLGPSSLSLAPRERRVTRGGGAAAGGDPCNLDLHHHHHHPLHVRLDRFPLKDAAVTSSTRCSTVATPPTSSTNQSASDQHQSSHSDLGPSQSLPSSQRPEGGSSSSSESLTVIGGGGARRGGDHAPPSHIPRAVSTSVSSSRHSLTSRGSSASSGQASPPPSSSSSSSSSFSGRLGQPPRGPLSLHSYSRKNVFLQHSLHTSELTALTQRDG